MNGGKGFGGGEATRDPVPTEIDPNDPKGGQQAIYKAESFAEYLAKRSEDGTASAEVAPEVAPQAAPVYTPPPPMATPLAPPVYTPPPKRLSPEESVFERVPLTGKTLEASLKMRCDLSGAGYAVFWANYRGTFKAVSEHVTAGRKAELSLMGLQKSFEDVSTSSQLDANGNSLIAQVARTGEPIFVPNAIADPDIVRREFAIRYGITQIAYEKYENGVIEYGTSVGKATANWDLPPLPPIMPKAIMRKAFEELGALYVMFWSLNSDGTFTVKADYESSKVKSVRERVRGDGQSFVSRSRQRALDAYGKGPVAIAARENAEVVVVAKEDGTTFTTVDGCDVSGQSVLQRADDLLEFGIRSVHLMPTPGGVLEYGVSGEALLSDVTLAATLEMECEAAGAAYAIYWTESRQNIAVVKDSYSTPEFKRELAQAGLSLDFADASKAFSSPLDLDNISPVATVLRTRKPVFIPDTQNYAGEFPRREISNTYNVNSIAFVPILGGVLEYGTSRGTGSTDWATVGDAMVETIPNSALNEAFNEKGATYAIFWRRNFQKGVYEVVANYESDANALNKQASLSGNTFATKSAECGLPITGDGPVAAAGRSGVEQNINIAAAKNFRRRELANEWGVGKMTLIPCATGVLEYGTVTKDKRKTTLGTEFQEAQRQYRRSVFGHDEWVEHRSADRFQKALGNLFKSGILRARYQEVGAVMAFASAVVFYDALTGGVTDLSGVKQAALLPFLPVITLPLSIFSLTAPSLGLLLVFRTNACYARWDDSRKVWGSIINKCRSVVRQSNTFFGDEYPATRGGKFRDGRRRVAAETSAFTRCLRTFLRGTSDEPILEQELKELGFTQDEVAGYMAAGNKQVYAISEIGATIRSANIDPRDRARMDETLSLLTDDIGACERIFKTPIPTVYTAHTSRFVGTWLGLLPLALYGIDPSWNHLVTIPAVGLVTFFLLGIEELGLQIEEPFSILPIESFCDASIYPALNAMVLTEDKERAKTKAFKEKALP